MSKPSIKSVTTFLHHADTDEEGIIGAYEAFDDKGNSTLQEVFQNGELVQSTERDYDAKGQMTEERIYSESEDPDQRLVYGDDANGRHELLEMHYAEGTSSYLKYTYDPATREEKTVVVDEGGNQESAEEKTYDAEGDVVKSAQFDENGKLIMRTLIEKDEKGRVKSYTSVGDDGKEMIVVYKYEFDEAERVAAIDIESTTGTKLRSETFEYDEAGRMIANHFEDFSNMRSGSNYIDYNEQGQVVLRQSVDADGKPTEETATTYLENGLVAELEIRTPLGVQVQRFEYELWA